MNYANKNTRSKLNKSVNLSLKILFKHITIKDSLCVGFKNNELAQQPGYPWPLL